MNPIQANLLKSISQPHRRLQTGSQETVPVEWIQQTSWLLAARRDQKMYTEKFKTIKMSSATGKINDNRNPCFSSRKPVLFNTTSQY